jgi:hypothetical protein
MIGIPSASRNILCSSAYATEVGARSWLKSGEGMRMLAKCAAWPASCISVVSPVSPEPTAHRHGAARAHERRAGAESERIGSSGARDARRGGLAAGSARLVKCVTVGCQLPSALTHAGCGLRAAAGGAGVGRCAQPAEGGRGRRSGGGGGGAGAGAGAGAPVAEAVGVLALAVEQVEVHRGALVRDAERGEGAAPLLEGKVRVELLGYVAAAPRHACTRAREQHARREAARLRFEPPRSASYAIRKPVFHGSSAATPLSCSSAARAATISGRVPCSSESRISKRATWYRRPWRG